MEIILLENILNLGNIGDKVLVKKGYGRNFLLPGGKAIPATDENLKVYEAEKSKLLEAEAKARELFYETEKRNWIVPGISEDDLSKKIHGLAFCFRVLLTISITDLKQNKRAPLSSGIKVF